MGKEFTRPFSQYSILIAEDDPDDQMLLQDAFEENHLGGCIKFVENGEELLDYLYRRDKFADPRISPRPSIILLDLNMPKKDGRETLREIRADEKLRALPIIVLTTSQAEDDINAIYQLGSNAYIVKPASYESLLETVDIIKNFWLRAVRLPDLSHLPGDA